MYFKNLQPYRLSTEWPITAEGLHEQLATKPFHPCGSQDFESRGWVEPCQDGSLVHESGLDWLVCMQTETKILPPAVVLEFLDVIRDQVAADEHEDAQALFDAEFALMTGELLRLLSAIVAAMGGELARTPDLIDNAKEQA